MQASSSSSSRIHGKRWNLRLTGRKRGSLVGLEQARRGKVKGHGRSTSFMVHCSLGEDRHFHRGHYLYDIADFSAAEQHEQLVLGAPPRPRRIILVRHGQSEGNIDEGAYTRIPDSKISLTEAGWRQAIECGKRIRTLVESDGAPDWKVYFYVSPYRRSLQTLKAIGMAFERERIAGVREEPRLREQDFGNFQDQERMRVEKEIRLRYGRFFYRFPNGESAADVYDRITGIKHFSSEKFSFSLCTLQFSYTGFRETLRADIDIGRFQRPEDRSKNVNLVLVSHGLTLRVFLMRWYKWTVEQFEGLWNFGNTGTMVMETGPGGRYSLLVHHTREELKAFGMTECMIDDQEWQKYAKPGELNYDWLTSGSNFFSHFDSDKDELSQMPSEIKDASSMRDFFQPEPPVGWPS